MSPLFIIVVKQGISICFNNNYCNIYAKYVTV